MFGAATDQNTFQSEKWGQLQFFPTKTAKWADNCRHCLLWTRKQGQTDECLQAPCNPDERDDHRQGYYSIHQMPLQSKKSITQSKKINK